MRQKVSIIITLSFCFFFFKGHAQQTLPCTTIEVQDLNSQQPYITGTCLEVSSDLHVAAKDVKMEADQRIHFMPGTKISPNQQGYFQASIRPNAMEVVWMEPGTSGVAEQYKKMELGVRFNAEIETHIDEFLSENQSDLAPRQYLDGLNPFDPDEIELYADFYYLSGPHIFQSIPARQYGFFYRDYKRIIDEEYPENSVWEIIETDYRFRIRFAPRFTGRWRCRVGVNINISTNYELADFEFNVVPSDGHDFVQVGSSNRFLTIADETFFPVGMNLSDPKCYYDVANNDPYNCENYPITNNGDDNPAGSQPYVYWVYQQELNALANAGANYVRFDILPWFSEIEFEKLANYDDRMNRAWELDQIVNTAEENDLFIHFNTHRQTPFEPVGYFFTWWWDWSAHNQYGSGFPCSVTGPLDMGYCYNNDPYLGLSSCFDFFTDNTAMHYYKNRLRYYIARYGYSTNIAVFETMNESNGFCSSKDYSINASTGDCEEANSDYRPYTDASNASAYRLALENWQQEMLYYMQRFMGGNQHVLSLNYLTEGPKGPDDPYGIIYADLITEQNYENFPDIHKNSMDIAAEVNAQYNKPLTHGETSSGLDYCTCDNDAQWIRDLWLGAFTGMCTGPLLWDNQHRQDLWPHFGRLKYFTQGIEFNDSGDNNHDGWTSEHDERGDHKAEMFCLRNWENGHKRAIGVIGNNTYNYYTQAEGLPCSDLNLAPDYTEHRTATIVNPFPSSWNELMRIQIPNMGAKVRYNIEWYNVMTGSLISTSTAVRSSLSGNLDLMFPPLSGDASRPIVLFIVYRYTDRSSEQNSVNNGFVNSDSAMTVFSPVFEMENSDLINPYLKMYPNPAYTEITIELVGESLTNGVIEILDYTGKTVCVKEMITSAQNMDISFLKDGVYLVRLQSEKSVFVTKLIKQ
ncbi:MAG: hypothetical protein C0592_06365 [Marinilabiliales bacterium]|nr:MAG: hypothetical protein C0592_06365 [Marinilabiliales bacterium]